MYDSIKIQNNLKYNGSVQNKRWYKSDKFRRFWIIPKETRVKVFHVLHQWNKFSTQHNNTVDNKIPLFYERDVSDPWFKFGSHIFRCVQADAIIIKLGLNCTHCTGPTCPPFNPHTLYPESASHTWTRPSVEPDRTN